MTRRLLPIVLFAVLAGAAPAAAANGRIAFVTDRYGIDEIASSAGDGGDVRRLTTGPQPAAGPAVSPDGTRIAFARGGDIWVMNADGTGQTALTGTEGSGEASPAWSPDGTRIVFVSNRTVAGNPTGPELWVMNADGSNVRRLTDTATGGSFAPAWSPDGTLIAFHSNVHGNFELYTIAADATSDTRVRRTTNFVHDQNPRWAPDGSRLVFERGAGTNVGDATKELYTRTLAGAELRLTTNSSYDVDPAFSPDGTRIVYTSDADGDLELFSLPAAGGAPVNLTNTTSGIADEQPDWGAVAAAPPPDPTPTATPTPTPTPQPPGDPVPPAGPACADKARVGAAEALGCLTRAGGDYRSTGMLLLSGLVMRPIGAAQLTIDPDKGRVSSGSGQFAVEIGGSVIFRGVIDWLVGDEIKLGAPVNGLLGSLPIGGDVEIRFGGSLQALVNVPVRLPFLEAIQRACGALCPSITAESTVIGDNAAGMLPRRAWQLTARNVPLGVARVENLAMTLDPAGGNWVGTSKLVFGTPAPFTVDADWRIERGALRSLTARLAGVRTPLSNALFLRRLDVGLTANPFTFRGSSLIEAGPTIGGRPALAFDSAFALRLAGPPGDARNTLRLDGQLRMLDFPTATGHAQLWASGAFEFGLDVAAGFPNPLASDPRREPVFVSAKLAGWATRRAFNAEAAAELLVLGQRAASAELVVSSAGFAACGELGWLRGGFGKRWGQPGSVFAGSCDVGPYRARAAQAGPVTLRLDDAALLRIRGAGGAPRVVLEGPGGRRIETGAPVVSDRFVVLQDATSTYVAVRRGGAWRVSAAPGSPAIAGVDTAAVLPKPQVRARVTGKGARRVLRWNLRRLPGQRVTFSEQGGAVLTRTTKARGSVRFRPGPGKSRARRIIAIVEQNGLPRDTLRVARYTAPALKKPARPRGLKATRRGSALVVTWRKVAGAARYQVHTAVGGRRDVQLVRGRRVRISGVERRQRAVVVVRAQRSDGVSGPSARVKARR